MLAAVKLADQRGRNGNTAAITHAHEEHPDQDDPSAIASVPQQEQKTGKQQNRVVQIHGSLPAQPVHTGPNDESAHPVEYRYQQTDYSSQSVIDCNGGGRVDHKHATGREADIPQKIEPEGGASQHLSCGQILGGGRPGLPYQGQLIRLPGQSKGQRAKQQDDQQNKGEDAECNSQPCQTDQPVGDISQQQRTKPHSHEQAPGDQTRTVGKPRLDAGENGIVGDTCPKAVEYAITQIELDQSGLPARRQD